MNGKRPIRLSEETRKFAYESLDHKYGQDTLKSFAVAMDDHEGFDKLTSLQKYDASIREIVTKAPIRIVPGERISGAATLGAAIRHMVPATFKGENMFYSISHLTIDFEAVLKKGIDHIKNEAETAYKRHKGTDKEEFALSCIKCLESLEIWHQRYLKALQGKKEYVKSYENLQNVPFKPAKSFYEAVQGLWFTFAFTRLCGNWSGIGRIDHLLGEYLENDLKSGAVTMEEARDILAHFFIKGCEWICGGDYGSGDAQHYQNIVLGGVDENGNDVTNTVTYLTLDILEELGISDFPTTVRINKNTDKRLITRVSEVIRYGGGVIAVYNEDLILEALTDYGYSLTEARKFANDGCWEVQIPGKTFFTYVPFDSLQILQGVTLDNYSGLKEYKDFDSLYKEYVKDLKDGLSRILNDVNLLFINTDIPKEQWKWKENRPCTVVSVFEEGCIEKGMSYLEGGPKYNVISPHIGGLPDTVNSLYAIKKLVFDDKKVTFLTLMELLKNNWQDNEALRQYALNKYSYFGNDNDDVDMIARDIINEFADGCDEITKQTLYKMPAGISTFGRQLEWSSHRFATPYGKKAHDILAANFSATPGTDKTGATAIIRSYCKAELKRTVSGAALDIKLLPSAVKGENGVNVIEKLIQGFVDSGGFFMQPDIADAELLKNAQERPEEYQSLSVRVSGWNARFVTLNKEWQDMVIQQTGSDV